MNRTLAACLGVAILLLFFCYRIWDIGPTHTDDAIWRLRGQTGEWDVVSKWAISQGRLFAFISGGLLFIGTLFQGTTIGSILHVGSFVVFFCAFHALLKVYSNTQVAFLAAILNLAMFAVRWEGSILTTYPFFSWTLGSIFILSLYLLHRVSRNNNPRVMAIALVLLFISLNIHEGVSVLMSVVAVIAVIGNRFQMATEAERSWTWLKDPHFLRQISATVGVVTLYFCCFIAWRVAFPTSYAGNTFGSFNPLTVMPVLASFSTSGGALKDFILPYKVTYADAISQTSFVVSYKPYRHLFTEQFSPIAMLVGLIVASLTVWLSVGWKKKGERPTTLPRWQLGGCVLVGLAIALIPVLPVSLVGKYQEHFYDLAVRSYAFTPLCHFGWCVVLAALTYQLGLVSNPQLKYGGICLVAGFLGVVAYCTSLQNDAVVSDMRQETCRWRVMDHLAELTQHLEHSISVVHAPRLKNGSWFTVVPDSYWSNYMEDRYGQKLRFENQAILMRESISDGIAFVDFIPASNDSRMAIYAAVLAVDSVTDELIATEIAIALAGANTSDRAQYCLMFQDPEHKSHFVRFSALSSISKNVAVLREVRAIPSSIRIARYSQVQYFNFEQGDTFALGSPVRFGIQRDGESTGKVAVDWLGEGWFAPEPAGVWSNLSSADLLIPLKSLTEREKYTIQLEASCYTGIGFSDQPQSVSVRIGNRVVASTKFARHDGWRTLDFEIDSQNIKDGFVKISLEIDPIANPAKLGISNDARDLGVNLKSLTIHKSGSGAVQTAKDLNPEKR